MLIRSLLTAGIPRVAGFQCGGLCELREWVVMQCFGRELEIWQQRRLKGSGVIIAKVEVKLPPQFATILPSDAASDVSAT